MKSRRVGLGKGRGKGYTNMVRTDPVVHQNAGLGKKTYSNPTEKKMMMEAPQREIHLSGHYFGMDKEGNKWKLSLGNLSDAGWFWDGDQTDMNGFFIRLEKSETKEEFLKQFNESKIDFEKDIKPLIKKAIEKNDGLYQISGDNVLWKFGQYETDDYQLEEDFKESGVDKSKLEKFKEAFYDNFTYDYDEFEKSYHGKELKKKMLELAEKSKTAEEYMNGISALQDDVNDEVHGGYLVDKESEAMGEAYKKVK